MSKRNGWAQASQPRSRAPGDRCVRLHRDPESLGRLIGICCQAAASNRAHPSVEEQAARRLRDLRSQLGATEDVPTVTAGWGRKLLPAATNVTKISCQARGVHACLGMGRRWGLLSRFSSATQCGQRLKVQIQCLTPIVDDSSACGESLTPRLRCDHQT